MQKSRLITPPQLHLPSTERDRHTTWLETFYDLVFAVAVASLGTRLEGTRTLLSFLQFLGLFLSVWWAWLGQTVYNTRFDTDDFIQRLFTFGIMLAAAAMAVEIPHAFEGASVPFAIAYLAARIFLLLFYIRAWLYVKEARPQITVYLSGFGTGIICWFISLFVPPPIRYLLWATGLLIDLLTPWFGQSILQKKPIDTSHLPERLGLFTIILLGEIITVVVSSIASYTSVFSAVIAAILCFTITACIWWIYFNFLNLAPFINRLGSGQPYIYLHLPLQLGLSLLSIGFARAIQQTTQLALPPETCWFIGGGSILWMTSGMLLKFVSIQERFASSWIVIRYTFFIVAIFVLLFVEGNVAPLLFLGIFSTLILVFTIFDVWYWYSWSDRKEEAGNTSGDIL